MERQFWDCRIAVAIMMAGTSTCFAGEVTLSATKDNTLYQPVQFGEPMLTSNGAGAHVFVGKTFSDLLRRALVQFDIAGNIPAGAQIDAVTLSLRVTKTRDSSSQPVTLHRLTADWGEGTSDAGEPGGAGAMPSANDATWTQTFFDAELWGTAGGDYVGLASATASAGVIGDFVVFSSTPELVSDVQTWLDSPETNFGWCARGNEVDSGNAKRLASREHPDPAYRPQLSVLFSVPALLGDMNCDGLVSVSDIGGFVLALTDPAGYAAQFPDCDINNADINEDNIISVSDIGPFVAVLTG